MNEFQKKFIDEAQDIISELENDLIKLEKNIANTNYIHTVFRHLHNIKGGAFMLGFNNLGNFIHELESIFKMISEGERNLNDEIMEVSFQSIDHIREILPHLELEDEVLVTKQNKLIDLLQNLQSADKLVESLIPELAATSLYGVTVKPQVPLLDNSEHPVFFVLEEIVEKYEHIFIHTGLDGKEVHFWLIIIDLVRKREDLETFFMFLNDDIEVDIHELGESNEYHFDEKAQKDLDEEMGKSGKAPSIDELKAYFADHVPAKESIQAKKETHLEAEKISTTSGQGNESGKTGSTRISLHKLNRLMNAVSELITLNSSLKSIASQYELNDLNLISEKIELEINHLQEDVFSMNLLSLNTLHTQFERLIRDLSRKMGKEVMFKLTGGYTELDKYMIESLKTPLLHIIRNSIDHGIESKEERLKKGKAEAGLIQLNGFYSGTNVIIEIQDDGRGIDLKQVRQEAIERNIIEAEVNLSQQEIIDLICHPGFSTAKEVTDVSGRGVGMDAVKQNVENLKGTLEISSISEQGTTIRICLPLSLSVINGLLVEVEQTPYIIPLFSINRIHRLPSNTIERENNFSSLVNIEGEQFSILNLQKQFREYPIKINAKQEVDVILLAHENNHQAIAVDTIKGEIQAIIKPIGNYFREQEFILGGSILGDGSLALVLDTQKLFNQYHSLN